MHEGVREATLGMRSRHECHRHDEVEFQRSIQSCTICILVLLNVSVQRVIEEHAMPPKSNAAELIAARALCLYSQMLRALAEEKKRYPGAPCSLRTNLSAQELDSLAKSALAAPRICGSFLPREERIISTKLGKLSGGLAWESSFRAEPLSVLLWGLGTRRSTGNWARMGENAYTSLDPDAIARDGWESVLLAPKRRSLIEIRRMRRIAELFAWRARIAGIQLTVGLSDAWHQSNDESPCQLFAKAIEQRAAAAKRAGLATTSGGDLVLSRKRFGVLHDALPSPTAMELGFIERFRACTWLLAPHTHWTKVDTATPMGFELPRRFIGEKRFLSEYFSPSDDSWSTMFG